MKTGFKDQLLPESAEDAAELARRQRQRFQHCMNCDVRLADPAAASSPAGWRETQISGTCETCFDAMFAEDDEDDDDE